MPLNGHCICNFDFVSVVFALNLAMLKYDTECVSVCLFHTAVLGMDISIKMRIIMQIDKDMCLSHR